MIRLWHAVIAALGLFALIGQTILTIDRGNSVTNLFSYFTIESNILVVITCILLVIRPDRQGTAFGMLRLASLTGITVTGIVYATVLAGNAELSGQDWWYDKIFHYIVPIMSVLGFLAMRPRTRLNRTALAGLAFPIVWLAYTLIRAEVANPVFALTPTTTATVPYGFLDADDLGGGVVAVICIVLTAAFFALSWFYIWFSTKDVVAPTRS